MLTESSKQPIPLAYAVACLIVPAGSVNVVLSWVYPPIQDAPLQSCCRNAVRNRFTPTTRWEEEDVVVWVAWILISYSASCTRASFPGCCLNVTMERLLPCCTSVAKTGTACTPATGSTRCMVAWTADCLTPRQWCTALVAVHPMCQCTRISLASGSTNVIVCNI